jgi:outer membrane protein assembly factor BamB
MKPTIANGTVYFLGNGGLNAVEEDTGKTKWHVSLSRFNAASHNRSPYDRNMLYLENGTIYMVAPDGSLTAYLI